MLQDKSPITKVLLTIGIIFGIISPEYPSNKCFSEVDRLAKTKTPFLSLGSQGSIGDTITSQRRNRETLVRVKPTPIDPYSLPQAYQRWLYQDYAYLWTQQSAAVRQAYASAGVRFHLTGLQYWMKVNLSNLTDIKGWWKLDEKTGAIAHDSSKDANNGIIYGASPSDGLIDGCRYFDGLNDYIQVPFSKTLNAAIFSFEFHAQCTGLQGTYRCPVCSRSTPAAKGYIVYCSSTNFWQFWLGKTDVWVTITGNPVVLDEWTFNCCIYDGTSMRWWQDGAYHTPKLTPFTPNSTYPLRLGAGKTETTPDFFFKGRIENFRYYNRVLDETDIKRHSERRYPVQ